MAAFRVHGDERIPDVDSVATSVEGERIENFENSSMKRCPETIVPFSAAEGDERTETRIGMAMVERKRKLYHSYCSTVVDWD